MGTSIKCSSCCSQEENMNEIKYGKNVYSFKIMASLNINNLID